MEIRGIGDTHALRRLLWLFVTTIVAPAVLLSLLALGAFGHSRWSQVEVAAREVSLQAPLVARLLEARAAALRAEVQRLAVACPEGTCAAPPGVLAWRSDGTWTPDPDALSSWATAQLAPGAGTSVALRSGAVPAPGAIALGGELAGLQLVPEPALDALDDTRRPLQALAAAALLVMVVLGAVLGLRSAAREIAASQRQMELLGRVSHELRTPMTSIRMFVDTLRAARLDPDRTRECLDLLSRESERLSRRIEEVLLWARMEAGARPYEQEPVAVDAIAEESLDAFRSRFIADERPPRVEVAIPDALPRVLGDRDALVEAVLNLLVNAHRHTVEPRRIVLAARLDGRRLGLSVSDNGPGIKRADRGRIFEKFYQGATADDDVAPTRGAGLGLAIVRAIVRAHGGRVELASSADRGSTFTLWLPVA